MVGLLLCGVVGQLLFRLGVAGLLSGMCMVKLLPLGSDMVVHLMVVGRGYDATKSGVPEYWRGQITRHSGDVHSDIGQGPYFQVWYTEDGWRMKVG